MTYGSIANMKPLCSLGSESTFDIDLTLVLTKANDFINSALSPYENTLPLVVVPAVVGSVAEFLAAGLYLQRSSPDEKSHVYVAFAQSELKKYISATYQNVAVSGKVRVTAYTEIVEDE